MPIDGGGFFTRLFDFERDRDDGIRILASRMDAELDNIADAFNSDTYATKVTYNGEQLSTVFDRILSKLNARIAAEDIAYGTSNVSAELQALRVAIDTNNNALVARILVQELRKYSATEIDYDGRSVAQTLQDIEYSIKPVAEGYWSNGANIEQEGAWAPSGAITTEGVWLP